MLYMTSSELHQHVKMESSGRCLGLNCRILSGSFHTSTEAESVDIFGVDVKYTADILSQLKLTF